VSNNKSTLTHPLFRFIFDELKLFPSLISERGRFEICITDFKSGVSEQSIEGYQFYLLEQFNNSSFWPSCY